MAQLVEALCYKSEGRGFDSRWCHWIFSDRTMAPRSTQPLTEMSSRDISWGVKAAGGNLYADFLEFLGASAS